MAAKDEFNKTYRGDIIGSEVIVLESAVSTNDVALEIGRDRDEHEGIALIADEQTGGRGRFHRRWISPPGVNLYCSVILKPDFVSADVQLVTLAAAVAVAFAIREHAGINAEIKWPNDILVNNRKVCGILVEMRSGGHPPSPYCWHSSKR
jgi:BirA family biotin operon repressor/biotin-[acetyl-CoA-carboxylase] ligase